LSNNIPTSKPTFVVTGHVRKHQEYIEYANSILKILEKRANPNVKGGPHESPRIIHSLHQVAPQARDLSLQDLCDLRLLNLQEGLEGQGKSATDSRNMGQDRRAVSRRYTCSCFCAGPSDQQPISSNLCGFLTVARAKKQQRGEEKRACCYPWGLDLRIVGKVSACMTLCLPSQNSPSINPIQPTRSPPHSLPPQPSKIHS
jgi:hypothetical protein